MSGPRPGSPHPPGAKPERGGVNFSVYSRHAQRVELLLFDDADASAPARVFTLDAHRHRTWHYWHIFVPGLALGQLYAWRMHGPFDPLRGHRFDADKLLLDPYGRAVAVPRDYRRGAAGRAGRNDAWAMKSVVAADHAYNWGGRPPAAPPLHADGHLRSPCARLHARPQLGR